MGGTRFSELLLDSQAGGGCLEGYPLTFSQKYWGTRINPNESSTFSVGVTGQFVQTLIGGLPPVPSVSGSGQHYIAFASHTGANANNGASWMMGDTSATTGASAPGRVFVAGQSAAITYSSINAFEVLVRLGTSTAASIFAKGTYIGFCPVTSATATLDTNGVYQPTTNTAGFYLLGNGGSCTVSLYAAGSSGGVQTAATIPNSIASTWGAKVIKLGVRITGNNKISYYINGRIHTRYTLTTAMTSAPTALAFNIANVNVTGGAGGQTTAFRQISLMSTIDPTENFLSVGEP